MREVDFLGALHVHVEERGLVADGVAWDVDEEGHCHGKGGGRHLQHLHRVLTGLRDCRGPMEAAAGGVHVLGDGNDGVGNAHLDGAPLDVGLGPAAEHEGED